MTFDTNIYDFQISLNSDNNNNIAIANNTIEYNDIDHHIDNQTICAMCHSKIKDCGLYSKNHDLIFCDLICAKIYSDNYEKIDVDFQAYRNNYILKKLSTSSEKIYQKYKYKFFQQLPILIIDDETKNILHQYLIENKLKDYKLQFTEIKSTF